MRLRQLLKAKLHHARITYCNPDYVGSIEIGRELMDSIGIIDGEFVHIWSVDGTSRITTYAFAGPAGTIGINGGAAHYFKTGEKIIVAAFDLSDEAIQPRVVLLDEANRIVRDMSPFEVNG
jgi:aspartate 1-decarboxylase